MYAKSSCKKCAVSTSSQEAICYDKQISLAKWCYNLEWAFCKIVQLIQYNFTKITSFSIFILDVSKSILNSSLSSLDMISVSEPPPIIEKIIRFHFVQQQPSTGSRSACGSGREQRGAGGDGGSEDGLKMPQFECLERKTDSAPSLRPQSTKKYEAKEPKWFIYLFLK